MKKITAFAMAVLICIAIAAGGVSRAEAAGPSAYVIPLSGITIDGNLGDWPKTMIFYPILNNGKFYGPNDIDNADLTTSPDLSPGFMVGYNPAENLIYLAVRVRDDSLQVSMIDYCHTDACEVYIDGGNTGRTLSSMNYAGNDASQLPALQYVLCPSGGGYGPDSKNPSLFGGDIAKTKTIGACTSKGNITTYEWAIAAFDHYPDSQTKLEAGKTIGFDVVVVDKDTKADMPAWVCWGPVASQKYLNANKLGKLLFLKSFADLGEIAGKITRAREKTAFSGCILEVCRDDQVAERVTADAQGKYAVKLLPGNYTVRPYKGQEVELPKETLFTVTAGKKIRANLALSPASASGNSSSQKLTAAPANIAGKWLGVMKVPGMELRMAFEISEAKDGGFSVVMHSIDQGIMDISMTSATQTGDSLRLELISAFAYEGRLLPDGNSITGNWVQGGLTPLDLKRVDQIPQLNRPQTPKKPYPYIEEEVAYPNSSADVSIAGTLTIPEGKGPFPAVLLISGSGRNDRNEAGLGHKPFLVLADHLTRQGIMVLRVDKRGVGKTTGTYSGSGMDEFASDALAGVKYLMSRHEADPKKIGLIGHSEGGSVAPMVAVRTPDVSYIVLLGAQGLSFYDLLVLQDGTEGKAAGSTDEEVALARGYSRRFYSIILEETEQKKIESRVKSLQDSLTEAEKKAIHWPNLGGTLHPSWALRPGVRKQMEFDIRPTLRQVKCPVLALNGGKDSQVPPKENLGGIEKELKAGGNRNVTVRELPGLNHMFQTCDTGAFSEYIKIEETMSPLALQAVSEWIQKQAGMNIAP